MKKKVRASQADRATEDFSRAVLSPFAVRLLFTQGLYRLMTDEERTYFLGLEICSVYNTREQTN